MSILSEFKQFAIKGNVIDMAVGIIIGAAFTSVVKTMVDEVVMPPLGFITGNIDFSHRFLLLKDGAKVAPPYETLKAAKDAGAIVVGYGQLINAFISLLLVSAVLFFLVRWINRLRPAEAPAAPTTKECPFCKSTVHKDASRCPACTSQLDAPSAA